MLDPKVVETHTALLFFVGDQEDESAPVADQGEADAFAGGFPVPPMPAGGAVRGAARLIEFGEGSSRSQAQTVPGSVEGEES